MKVNKISRTEVKYAKQYMYDRGIKDTNFTDVTCGAFENKGSCTVGENSITITNPSRPYSNAYIITTKKIDLTNFKTLNFISFYYVFSIEIGRASCRERV